MHSVQARQHGHQPAKSERKQGCSATRQDRRADHSDHSDHSKPAPFRRCPLISTPGLRDHQCTFFFPLGAATQPAQPTPPVSLRIRARHGLLDQRVATLPTQPGNPYNNALPVPASPCHAALSPACKRQTTQPQVPGRPWAAAVSSPLVQSRQCLRALDSPPYPGFIPTTQLSTSSHWHWRSAVDKSREISSSAPHPDDSKTKQDVAVAVAIVATLPYSTRRDSLLQICM